MSVLMGLDPDRELELLHSISMEEPEANWSTTPPKLEIAQHVFQVLAERDGERVLPVLEQEAENMGKEGPPKLTCRTWTTRGYAVRGPCHRNANGCDRPFA
jgi:hypothetical protein